jgi:hypothetical protein
MNDDLTRTGVDRRHFNAAAAAFVGGLMPPSAAKAAVLPSAATTAAGCSRDTSRARRRCAPDARRNSCVLCVLPAHSTGGNHSVFGAVRSSGRAAS